MIKSIAMDRIKKSDNTDIPNGQLMHLATEVVKKSIESSQSEVQNRDFSYFNDMTFPPVCAL